MTENKKQGKVYKITNDIDELIYIGSTKQTLTKRFGEHKYNWKNDRNDTFKIYKHMKEIGFNHFRITLIENYEYKDKEELRQREDYYIQLWDTEKNGLNGCGAIANPEQARLNKLEFMKNIYYPKNRDKILEEKKEYYETNKDNVLRKNKVKITCVCGSIITTNGKAQHLKSKKHKAYDG